MTAAKRDAMRDQQLINLLLCGRIARKPHQEPYLKDGSTEELEARRALARLLRTSLPLDLGVRFVLADLIDPDQDVVNRRIRFVYRRKGKRSNALLEKEIATHILARVQAGIKRELAIEDAIKKFNLKPIPHIPDLDALATAFEATGSFEWQPKRKV